MEFCDNRKQLFQAYFRDFTIERLDNPWQAFTGGWHLEVSKFCWQLHCISDFFQRNCTICRWLLVN